MWILTNLISSSVMGSIKLTTGVSARYWRIYGVKNYSNNNIPAISAAEIEMRSSIGGSNLATGGTPYADSIFSASYPSSNAFDGTPSSFWVSSITNGGTHWIAYDFVTDVEIVEISYSKRPDSYGQAEAIIIGVIQYSHDNVNWNTYWIFETPATWGTGAETRIFSKGPLEKKSWRIRTTQTQLANQRQSFAEVEFRLTSGGANQATGGTAISASSYSNLYKPSNAFDSNNSNYVSNGSVVSNAPQWIGYIFTEGKDINEVMIRVRSDEYGANEGTVSAVVESSYDYLNWVEEWSFTTPATWLNNSNEERVFTRPGV